MVDNNYFTVILQKKSHSFYFTSSNLSGNLFPPMVVTVFRLFKFRRFKNNKQCCNNIFLMTVFHILITRQGKKWNPESSVIIPETYGGAELFWNQHLQ